jgi:LPXTG-site transpeptidase (sortase) family protein
LRSGLRTGRKPQAPSRAAQQQPVSPTRNQLAVWVPVACVSLAAALILGLTLGLVRNVLARPTSSAPVAVQDGDTKTSAAAISAPAQPTQRGAGRPTAIATEGSTATASSPPAVEATLVGQPATLQPSQAYTPTRIVASSVGVDAPVVPIALVAASEDGSEARWEVPAPDVAGWHETSAPLGISGNTVINGHNWPQEAVFRDLHKIEPGEAIAVYADELGFAYEVTEVVLLPEQGQSWEVQLANTHYIDPTDDDRLTIITCHPYGSVRYRLVVVALRTELAQPDGL